jgi:SPP1 family predicted phage head-tail adaptor
MRAGLLDRIIAVDRNTGAANAWNEPVDAWTQIARTFARVREGKGGEFLQRDQVSSARKIVFTIRHNPEIRVTDRVRYDGATFNILSVVEIGRRRGTELHAESVS